MSLCMDHCIQGHSRRGVEGEHEIVFIPARQTLILRAGYWHGILPRLLGEKGQIARDGFTLPTWLELV